MGLSKSPLVLSYQVAQQEANGLMPLLLRSFNSPQTLKAARNPEILFLLSTKSTTPLRTHNTLRSSVRWHTAIIVWFQLSGLSTYFRGDSANNQEANSHASHVACIIPVAPEGLAPSALTCIHLDAEYNQGIWVGQGGTSLKDLRHPAKCVPIQILMK